MAILNHSNKDNEPYVNDLCQSLEPTYRLCLLHRDLAGIYTSEAFKSALQASKRHLVLMSGSFLSTEWEHFQDLVLNPTKLVRLAINFLLFKGKAHAEQRFERFSISL